MEVARHHRVAPPVSGPTSDAYDSSTITASSRGGRFSRSPTQMRAVAPVPAPCQVLPSSTLCPDRTPRPPARERSQTLLPFDRGGRQGISHVFKKSCGSKCNLAPIISPGASRRSFERIRRQTWVLRASSDFSVPPNLKCSKLVRGQFFHRHRHAPEAAPKRDKREGLIPRLFGPLRNPRELRTHFRVVMPSSQARPRPEPYLTVLSPQVTREPCISAPYSSSSFCNALVF